MHWKPIDVFSSNLYSEHGEDGILSFLFSRSELKQSTYYTYVYLTNYTHKKKYKLKKNPILCLLKTKPFRPALNYIDAAPWLRKMNLNSISIIMTHIHESKVDLLAVDIYGNDFWILKKFIQECKPEHKPNVIVVNYNHCFPSEISVTVPYSKSATRESPYHGASLLAYCTMLQDYRFIGCSLYGEVAVFIKEDVVKDTTDPYLQPANVHHCFLYPNVQQHMRAHWPWLQKRMLIKVI